MTTRNEILHSCGDEGENGVGEAQGTPLPAPALATEPGGGGGAGMVSWLERKGTERGRVGGPGTADTPCFPRTWAAALVTQKLVLRKSD